VLFRSGGGRPPLRVSNLHRSGSDIDAIKSRFAEIQQRLDPKCRAFLESGGGNVNGFVGDLLGNDLLAAGSFRSSVAAFTGTAGTDVPKGYAAMVVNDNGAFFNSGFTVDQGKLPGKTPKAQAFILLHELGHALGANGFQSDFNNSAAGQANDKLIEGNCQATLNTFSSSN
jgi:hypothetical protein